MTFDVDAYDKNGTMITNLVQWDRDVYVYVEIGREPETDEIYYMKFFNCSSGVAYVADTSYENGMILAKIPNILLQESKPITGYIDLFGGGDERGVLRFRINVRPMPRPLTYTYPDSRDYLTIVSVLDECVGYAEATNLSMQNVRQSEANAAESERKASEEATVAENYAKVSESWAIGGTGARDGEDTDNAKYYSDQAKLYKEDVEEASSYSQSYAVGGTGTRDGEDTDNIKYYYENIKTLTANFDFASLEEVETFIGVDVSGGVK